MLKLNIVLLGLVAVLVFEVFQLHVNACDLIRIEETKDSKSTVNENCPKQYVAISCECSGSCLELYHVSPRKCRAGKEQGKSTTLALTCLRADDDDYYIGTDVCDENPGDEILHCNLVDTESEAQLRVEREVQSGQCVITGSVSCPDCEFEALCKRAPGTTGGSSR